MIGPHPLSTNIRTRSRSIVGKRGPKPKPLALKILAGNPGGRPLQVGPVCKLTPKAPPKPDYLSDEAAAEWDRLVPELEAVGMLATVDRAALVVLCEAWADLQRIQARIRTDGDTLEEPIQNSSGEVIGKRLKAHPIARLQQQAYQRWVSLLRDFGLSPGARDRLGFVKAASASAQVAATNQVRALVEQVHRGRTGG